MSRGYALDLETRSTPVPIEMRQSASGRSMGGYAAVFNSPSKDLGGFVEIVTPSAFSKSRGDNWPGVVQSRPSRRSRINTRKHPAMPSIRSAWITPVMWSKHALATMFWRWSAGVTTQDQALPFKPLRTNGTVMEVSLCLSTN